jgi:type VI secretion system protein ImpA
LDQLGTALSKQMGEAAPGLAQVRKALLECQALAQQILQRKGPAPPSAPEVGGRPAESGAAAQPNASPAARRPLTRDDVLTRLADASALLLQMEPHSPVAYLVQRAVKLARLPLPDLMRVLIRDPGVLGQLDRDLDLGLEKQEAAKQEAAKAAKSR